MGGTRIPLSQARGAGSGGRRASALDFGGGTSALPVAEGLSDLATVGARITHAEYGMRAGRALAASARRLTEASAAIAADPALEAHEWESRYDEELETIRAEEAEDLPPQYRDAYDAGLADFEQRARLGLRAEGQKRQLTRVEADLDQALVDLGNESARAETDQDRAFIDGQAGSLIGQALGLRAIDDAGADKRRRAYQGSVAAAALARGLEANPTATRALLEQRAGPFAAMDEKPRQEAILATTKREETLARADRAEARYQIARQKEARIESKRSAQTELAIMGRPDGPGVTSADVLARAEALGPETEHWFGVVAKGGKVGLDAGERTPAQKAATEVEEARLASLNPVALVTEPLDAAKLGPRLSEWQARQTLLKTHAAAPGTGWVSKRDARVTLGTADPWGFDDPLLEDDVAAETFRQRADIARAQWIESMKKAPDDADEYKILDDLILEIAGERRAGGFDVTVSESLGVLRPLAAEAPPKGAEAVAGQPGVFRLPDGRLIRRAVAP